MLIIYQQINKNINNIIFKKKLDTNLKMNKLKNSKVVEKIKNNKSLKRSAVTMK